jgi:mannose-6-phosphate isomerase-like protein (cupin superfamily)
MPQLVPSPTRIPVPGNKLVEEYIGHVNSSEGAISIAHMHSPPGWSEPGQQPDFDEFTLVLRGSLRVESRHGTLDVRAGQAVIARRGEWVRYSTPDPEGAEYVAICLPAFQLAAAHRDA